MPALWTRVPGSQQYVAHPPLTAEFWDLVNGVPYWGNVGPKAVLGAFSGLSINPVTGEITSFGGGADNSSAYMGNEVYVCTEGPWTRLTNPSRYHGTVGTRANMQAVGPDDVTPYPNGRHSYNCALGLPVGEMGTIAVTGGAIWNQTQMTQEGFPDKYLWLFDRASVTWSRQLINPALPDSIANAWKTDLPFNATMSFYDSVLKTGFWFGNKHVLRYNIDTKLATCLRLGPAMPEGCAALDVGRGIALFLVQGIMVNNVRQPGTVRWFRTRDANGVAVPPIQPKTMVLQGVEPGALDFLDPSFGGRPSLTWDTARDRFIVWAGSERLWAITLNTSGAEPVGTATNIPTTSADGTFPNYLASQDADKNFVSGYFARLFFRSPNEALAVQSWRRDSYQLTF